MPANKKYLTTSSWQRFAKISAGILGGYIISALLHMTLALWLPVHMKALITSVFTLYMSWCTLIVTAFLFKNGWKTWALYLGIILLLFGTYFLGIKTNPFV